MYKRQVLSPFTLMGVIPAALKIVMLINVHLFLLLYEADPTPDRPQGQIQILGTPLELRTFLFPCCTILVRTMQAIRKPKLTYVKVLSPYTATNVTNLTQFSVNCRHTTLS